MPTIRTVPIESIRQSPFNPTIRTEKAAIADLIAYMRDRMDRGLPPLPNSERLLIGKDGFLGDGHRRLAALKAIGVKTVCIERDPSRTAAEIWRDRNSGKPLNSAHVSSAARLGLDEIYWPYRVRRQAAQLRNLAGEEAVDVAITSGLSVSVVSILRVALDFCGRFDQPFALQLLRWMGKYNTVRFTRNLVDYRLVQPDALIAAVTDDRPLQVA